ncbi:MAG: reverse transcriptase-like protein [Armatimonadota bacterium]
MRNAQRGTPTHALVSAVQSPDALTAGIAFILRDRNRDTVYSSSYSIESTSLITAAYRAILEALYKARDTGAGKMTVYCDVASVVGQLHQNEQVPSEAISLHLQVRALMNQFDDVEIKVAHSGEHFIAHKLAAGAAQEQSHKTSELGNLTLFPEEG